MEQSSQRCTTVLTRRETEVLGHLAQGRTYEAIAGRMGLSRHTVDTYLRRIRTKTGLADRTQLAVLAARLAPADAGWPEPAGPAGHSQAVPGTRPVAEIQLNQAAWRTALGLAPGAALPR